MADFTITIDAWPNGGKIPDCYAFCRPDEGSIGLSENRSPRISWSGAPAGTRSFAILCHDPDVPSRADDVNQPGKIVPASLPRVDFYHWVLVDVPATLSEIPEGGDSDGVTARGKPPGKSAYGVRGINNYTDWFAGDADMAGDYGGYDGPCPPWNDELVHHYHFTVYALDVPTLGLTDAFGGEDAKAAMAPHTLACASWVGTYTLNPGLRAL
jgi:Raf kinase inhibitor-like YbhB/YbcL family protein